MKREKHFQGFFQSVCLTVTFLIVWLYSPWARKSIGYSSRTQHTHRPQESLIISENCLSFLNEYKVDGCVQEHGCNENDSP